MEQLTFFGEALTKQQHLRSPVVRSISPKDNTVQLAFFSTPAKKPIKANKKPLNIVPDITFVLDKKKLVPFGDVGILKYNILCKSGVIGADLLEENDKFDLYEYVRNEGRMPDILGSAAEANIRIGFYPDTERALKRIKKKFLYRNIQLKVDLGKEDLKNV